MSKQYLTAHTVDDAHVTDIFSLATTPRAVLSASGSSTLHVHDTTNGAFTLKQSIPRAHKLGCHHICASANGKVAASAGFGGEISVWALDGDTGEWRADGGVETDGAGEAWALALSEDGAVLAASTHDGSVNVWNIADKDRSKVHEYETGSPASGSFGMCVDLSRDGKYIASGHQNGSVYVFNNRSGRIMYSLSGLVKPVRAVAFSPGSSRLAAAGDAGVIALYDMKHGEHVGNLTGHASWITSLDWSFSGEYLLSASMDGKVKVWSVERAACVATHSETDKALWAARWLPKTGRGEMFCTAGANRSISFYREASGG
ncbi:WD40/YVTN repeat-like-containing domain protein [Ophiocordyceps camponoti-floridani]|uniref:WD40/YVTN repeat-like-containing domain protein n=1 Tax=Ophiocordyceps camponoti-floridani TaxID=2030778 RepID=A0A8H4Q432_9HYPO|nr:WD40/YVTN repeat-like-containing domain protein [Ophiocordyceps camponoti-floridani]